MIATDKCQYVDKNVDKISIFYYKIVIGAAGGEPREGERARMDILLSINGLIGSKGRLGVCALLQISSPAFIGGKMARLMRLETPSQNAKIQNQRRWLLPILIGPHLELLRIHDHNV